MKKSEEMLRTEIDELKSKIAEMEANRQSNLETNKTIIRDLRKRTKELEAGSMQMNDMMNSILMVLASRNGGELRIPKDHLKITRDMEWSVIPNDTEYVFKLKEGKDDSKCV